MKTYDEGYTLAQKDIDRFGYLHAMDKLHLFEGDFQTGYAKGIDSALDKPERAVVRYTH